MVLIPLFMFHIFLVSPFTVGRYHSLVIEKESFPSDELEITAWTEDGLIMAARHKVYRHLQVRFLILRLHQLYLLVVLFTSLDGILRILNTVFLMVDF